MTIENYEQAHEDAVAAFEALKAEQSRLPALYNQALEAGDTTELLALRQRQDSIGQELFSSEISAIKAHLDLCSAESYELKEALKPALALVREAEAAVAAAEKQLLAARQAAGKIENKGLSLRTKRQTLQRQLEDKIALQVGAMAMQRAPVVRSVWQMPR